MFGTSVPESLRYRRNFVEKMRKATKERKQSILMGDCKRGPAHECEKTKQLVPSWSIKFAELVTEDGRYIDGYLCSHCGEQKKGDPFHCSDCNNYDACPSCATAKGQKRLRFETISEGDEKQEYFSVQNDDGMTALMEAARYGCAINVFEKLKHTNINRRDKNGWSALMWATSKGHWQIVRKLLDWNAYALYTEARFVITFGKQKAKIDAVSIAKAYLDELRSTGASSNHDKHASDSLTLIKTQWDKHNAKRARVRSEGLHWPALLEEPYRSQRRRKPARRRLGDLHVATLVLGITVALLLLGYLAYELKRRLTSKRQPVDTDLEADLESGLALE